MKLFRFIMISAICSFIVCFLILYRDMFIDEAEVYFPDSLANRALYGLFVVNAVLILLLLYDVCINECHLKLKRKKRPDKNKGQIPVALNASTSSDAPAVDSVNTEIVKEDAAVSPFETVTVAESEKIVLPCEQENSPYVPTAEKKEPKQPSKRGIVLKKRRTRLRKKIRELQKENIALTSKLAEEQRERLSCIKIYNERLLRQGFLNRRKQNLFKLKILVRVAEESELHSYALNLDDVMEMLHETKFSKEEMDEYRKLFGYIYPDALNRVRKYCPSFSPREELYFMFVALSFCDYMIKETLGIGSAGLMRMRFRLCPFFGLKKEKVDMLDDKIEEVMLHSDTLRILR